jgi:hypothetical protein
LNSMIFHHHGAAPHFAIIVRHYLNNTFRNTWIGRAAPKHWAPSSLDLTPLHFFAWG